MEALSALKRLQELLQEGAEPFAKRVILEIGNADVAEKGPSHDDAHAATPLLREIQEGAELIRVEVRRTSNIQMYNVRPSAYEGREPAVEA